MKRIFALFLLLFAGGSPAWADDPAFEIGSWQGHRIDHDGAFSHCAATNVSGGEDILILAVGGSGVLAVAASAPGWKFRKGATLMAAVMVDDDLIADQVQVTDTDTIRLVYENASEAARVYQTISAGRRLTIRTPAGSASFDLAAAPQALGALVGCVQQALAHEGGASDEVGAIYQESEAVRMERSEAMVFVVNMLAAAGLTGQVYLAPSEYRDTLPDFDVAWRNPDGTLGAAALFSNAGDADMELAARNILGLEAARCRGDFASGVRRSRETESAAIKELFTTCSSDDGDLETYYVVYVTDDGLLLATGTLALTAGQNDAVEDTGEAIARGLQEHSF